MTNTRLRTILAVLLATAMIAAVSSLIGCTTDGDGDGEKTTETIKVGVHTSLTGGLADYGFAAQEGIKLAGDDLTGFEAGDKKYEIELVIKDDKGEPAESPIVAQQLIDEGVVAVIGALTSGNTNSAQPIYAEAGIPMISGSATRADLVPRENFFRTCVGDNIQGKALADWCVELGFEKVAIMDDRGDYAVGLADVVEGHLTDAGVEVLREAGQEGDTDFSAQVAKIQAFAPDAVMFTGYHREAGLLYKQCREAGMADVQFMGGDGIKSDEIADEAGGAANVEGVLATIGGIPQDSMAGWEDFKTAYMEATDKEPGPYAETNHDALVAIVEAIKKGESADPADILKNLSDVEVNGVIGTFGFDANGEFEAMGGSAGLATIVRYKIENGAWVSAD
ncbi:MAG: branched-chain amino acid ABC transporter substrate-binding protein [Coriobacteriia bacterium]|nr:branched-chain amino acid ABC transporter substrate-binding protein [Coriobacteriia bacterium]